HGGFPAGRGRRCDVLGFPSTPAACAASPIVLVVLAAPSQELPPLPPASVVGVVGQMTTRAGMGAVGGPDCPLAWRAWPGGRLPERARRRRPVSVIATIRHAISTPATIARSTTSERSR